MAKNCNKRNLEDIKDPLERAYADLKASIEKACKGGERSHPKISDIRFPATYKVVSRGDDDWRR